MFNQNLMVSVCFLRPQSMAITQISVLASVQFLKLPPPQRAPPSSPHGEAPSSSGTVSVPSRASPTTQTARVRRIWLGATATTL